MQRFIAGMACLLSVLATPAAAFTRDNSETAVLRWINSYRHKPDVVKVPDAFHALSRLGALAEPEKAAVYSGFLAGVIWANQDRAEAIVDRILPLPDESQWVVVQAIAYSGARNWQAMLAHVADKVPVRRVMLDKYLAGKLPRLDQFAIDRDPAWYEKVEDAVSINKYLGPKPPAPVKLANTPELLDTLWGFYFAAGTYAPIGRIIAYLPWSKDRDSVERLTLGNMAKYTLANNAARDGRLLDMLKYAADHDPAPARGAIKEVIDAAETVDTARVRKEALSSIEELQRKGPGSKRDMAWWGYIGEGAIAVGCVAAAASGVVAAGLPCVIGGATTSYALRTWTNTQ
ncbi:MAG: hypothetical protein ACXWJ5_00500 [Xanthobacteraceae bacterium]